jgi:tetratricopeptide (TPR) repeat protein
LAYIYDQLGNFEKAIWAVNQYIELAPDEPNPYDTRGDLYAFHGDIDHAIESYQKVLEIKPNFTRTREKIGHMHIFAGRYDRAEAEFGQLARSDQPDVRSRGEFLLAMIPIYRGQLRDGLSLLDAAIASDESMGLHNESYTYKMYMRTLVLYDLDRPDLAYDALLGFQNGIWEIFPVFASEFDLVFSDLCATIGRVEVADSVVSTYETVLDTMAQSAVEPYLGAKGMIALAKGDPGLALRYFQRLDDLAPNDYQTQYRLALTYLELDRVDDAIAVMERALARYGPERLFFTDCNVRGYFLLGTAYQRAGRSAEAIEQYQKFVDIWRDADPELSDEVADAKARIERLKSAG